MASYEIIIKAPYAGMTKSPVANSMTAAAKDKQQGSISALAAYGYTKKIATQLVSHNVNTVSLRTGQTELQQKIALKYDIARNAWNFFETIAIGGGIAGIPGAIAGGVLSLSNTLVNVAIRQDTININRDLENVSLSQNNLRAGVGRSRREN